MTQIKIRAPRTVDTTIILPASKSISNRALIINALSQSSSYPDNLSECDDTRVMVKALMSKEGEEIDIMAAGTAMRFLTAYLSVLPGSDRIITGSERMKKRPIKILVEALRKLGAEISYINEEGFPPLRIKGKVLIGGSIDIPGSVSSQYISALMMIGATLTEGLEIKLTGDIISRPYINLTMELMKQFGATAFWKDEATIKIEKSQYKSMPFYIENDWSAASYWYQIAALSQSAKVVLPMLFADSLQGDSKVAEIFDMLGVKTEYRKDSVTIAKKSDVITEFNYDFVNQPDLAQTFVVTCSLLNIPFRFTGLQSLKIKETDRIEALKKEMIKLGYVIHDAEDSILWWDGERAEPSYQAIDTYEDHRMAMAFAPAALVIDKITINNPEVVSKSYPRYFEDLKKAGFFVEEVE